MLHVQLVLYTCCIKLYAVLDDSVQKRFNIKVGFCVPCVSGNCPAQHVQTGVLHVKRIVLEFPPVWLNCTDLRCCSREKL